MQMIVCSVFDVAAGVYSRPFFVASKGLAIRSFQDEVSRKADDNPMSAHPADFKLFYLGTFDDLTGKFTGVGFDGVGQPELLLNGSDR